MVLGRTDCDRLSELLLNLIRWHFETRSNSEFYTRTNQIEYRICLIPNHELYFLQSYNNISPNKYRYSVNPANLILRWESIQSNNSTQEIYPHWFWKNYMGYNSPLFFYVQFSMFNVIILFFCCQKLQRKLFEHLFTKRTFFSLCLLTLLQGFILWTKF